MARLKESTIRRRLKKAEEKLNLNRQQITVNVIYYGHGGELPPDWTVGNMAIHPVRYEDIREENYGQKAIETA